MNVMTELLDALYKEQKSALVEENWFTASAYDIAVDLADNFSKGQHPSVWLPRYEATLRDLAATSPPLDAVAYSTAAFYASVLLASIDTV